MTYRWGFSWVDWLECLFIGHSYRTLPPSLQESELDQHEFCINCGKVKSK